MEDIALNLEVILPFLIVAVGGLLLMFIDFRIPEDKKENTGWIAAGIIAIAFVAAVLQWNGDGTAFVKDGFALVIADNYSVFLNLLYLITGFLTVLISVGYVKNAGIARGEYYFLMLFSICGMMLMGMANELILMFLALELLSIPLYILSGFDRNRLESEESALKYFLLGAFSSGFLVFGIALTYGATQSTALPDFATIGEAGPLGMAAIAMLLVGFAFKVGAVPFHMWTPDVYEGAPTTVTAFMSVGAKVGGFAAMIRLFASAFESVNVEWIPAVAVISALTMVVGNVAAIAQQNIKRMLAYSSIAHAGYILMAVAASGGSDDGISAALYYMLTYLFTNLGAFAIVSAIERNEGKQGLLLDDYKGLSKRNFGYAIVLMYLMLSLTGIPLTGGFTGKFYVFGSAVQSGMIWLVIIGALTSVVSAFYYLRVVFYSFMYDGPGQIHYDSTPLRIAVGTTVIVTIILGVFPGPFYQFAQDATISTLSLLAGG